MSIERLTIVFREVFGDDALTIGPQTTAKDVPDWDSFNHINLIVAIEEAFNVTFSTEDIASMANVGKLVEILRAKGVDIAF